MNLPLATNPSGLTIWAVPGREPDQETGLQHLTWAGPGHAIHRHTHGIRREGIEYPGRDIRTVSDPCENDAEAQQAVDTYLASLGQDLHAAANTSTLATAVGDESAVSHGTLMAGALAVALSARDLYGAIAQSRPDDPGIGQCLPLIAETAVSLAACADMIHEADPDRDPLREIGRHRLNPAHMLYEAAFALTEATQDPAEPDERPIAGRAAWVQARLRRPPAPDTQPDAGPLPAEARFTADKAAYLADVLLPGYLTVYLPGTVGEAQTALGPSPAAILPQLSGAAAVLGWSANTAAVNAVHAGAPFRTVRKAESAAQSLWSASAQLRVAWAQAGGPVPGTQEPSPARASLALPAAAFPSPPATTRSKAGRDRPAGHSVFAIRPRKRRR
jgi:hypothetical protein